MSKSKCYITTPIYYASGVPTIGNSYTTVACDVLARYNRLMDRDTFYLTGMDEHGQKIADKASQSQITPQAYVDKIAEATKELWHNMGISYDGFIRTTDEHHVNTVKKVFEKLLKQGDIYLGSYSGNYCVSCETFFTKTQLGENDTCPDCGKPTTLVSEESYFLNLKKYANKLLTYINEHPDFIMPTTRRNEVVSFIEAGLEDLCVSRTTVKWGINIDSNPKHVIYVWIDALMNYLTALGYDEKDDKNYQKYWLDNTNIYQVVGKDILRFHAIYWPIILMALDLPINFKLYVHGWILCRDGKMSKSRGNAVYPMDLIKRYGLDAVRYYLTKELPLGNDGLFSYERFIERFNNDLVNDLGNLLSRSVAMVEKYFDGINQNIACDLSEYDKSLEQCVKENLALYKEKMDNFLLQDAYEAIWNIVRRANKYIDETQPWALSKNVENLPMLKNVMYHLIESLRVISVMVSPCLIESSPKMLQALGLDYQKFNINELAFGYQYENEKVQKIDHLFKRLDLEKELEEINKEQAPKEVVKEIINEITIDDFNKVNLNVGEIIACKPHENAEKLLVSQIKIGDKVCQIVSGIAKFYKPEDLIGKKVIVVTNLKPVKIRGVESNGMVLCASHEDKLELIEVNEAPSGSKIR